MKILVLLSTWNGCSYVREQLESILSQDVEAELHLVVRDDGSSDNTVQIIEALRDSRIELIRGENIGAKASFFALIAEACKRDADFVAFSDQDDVWKPEKLRSAVEKLTLKKGPELYCSALDLVDVNLRPIGHYKFIDKLGFNAAFFSNCATGCTCVINRDLLDLLYPLPSSDELLMHDWWLYLVASAFGRVIYDQSSYILYRQHSSNQVGMRTGYVALLHRLHMFLRRAAKPSRLTQATEFGRIYGHRLIPLHRNYLNELQACKNSFFKRINFALKFRPHRKGLFDELSALAVFILGR